LPAEVLDDQPAGDDPEAGTDAEDRRQQPDAARDLLTRELVADDAEREREDPPATPWITRATIRTESECESAASNVPPARMTSVHRRTRSLPSMSPTPPEDGRSDRRRQEVAGEEPGDAVLRRV
jgi:hypothetical protein